MSYKALYRTYRPQTFDDVVGQDVIVKTLRHAITQDKIAHAYLFCGPRGTGKTSIAKLMAKAINCTDPDKTNRPCNQCSDCKSINDESNPDVVEIDAASNNGVDQIRSIIDQVKFPPMESRYKVYIIDEVHMLSSGAFNALLKTLEEPPAYVVFILATTEPHKVLPTIISRCQRYDFKKVDAKDMGNRLRYIMDKEGIEYEPQAIDSIITLADGGMRDALSILDQCIAYGDDHLSSDVVNSVYGITSIDTKLKLIDCMMHKDVKTTFEMIDTMDQNGIDLRRLILDLMNIFKEAVCYLYTGDVSLLQHCDQSQMDRLTYHQRAHVFLDAIDIWLKTSNELKYVSNLVSYFQVSALKTMECFDQTMFDQTSNEMVKPNDTVLHTTTEDVVKPQTNSQSITEVSFDAKDILVQPIPEADTNTIDGSITQVSKPMVQESMVETNVSHETSVSQPQPRIQSTTTNVNDLTDDQFIALLAGSDRTSKTEDEQRFKQLEIYRSDLKSARLISLLEQTNVYAAGSDFILVTCPYQDVIDTINEAETEIELERFYKNAFRENKRIYALTIERGKTLRQQFAILFKAHNLPQPLKVEFRSLVTPSSSQQSPLEAKLKAVFNDQLIIKE